VRAPGLFNYRLKWRPKFPTDGVEFLLRISIWDENTLTPNQVCCAVNYACILYIYMYVCIYVYIYMLNYVLIRFWLFQAIAEGVLPLQPLFQVMLYIICIICIYR
jgi:hypothetical protein